MTQCILGWPPENTAAVALDLYYKKKKASGNARQAGKLRTPRNDTRHNTQEHTSQHNMRQDSPQHPCNSRRLQGGQSNNQTPHQEEKAVNHGSAPHQTNSTTQQVATAHREIHKTRHNRGKQGTTLHTAHNKEGIARTSTTKLERGGGTKKKRAREKNQEGQNITQGKCAAQRPREPEAGTGQNKSRRGSKEIASTGQETR